MAGNSTDPGRSVTSKVTAILMAFRGGAVLSLTEIASIAKLPTSTAHRLAFELLAWRLLERTESGGYRVGLPLRIIGKDTTGLDTLNRAILIVLARPVLAELARTAHTDVRLGALNTHEVIHLAQFSDPVGTSVGPDARNGGDAHMSNPTRPAHATALGQALLAFSPTELVDKVIADGSRMAGTTAVPDHLRQTLSVIRLTQIATVPDGELAGASSVAMPVFSGGGRVAAAVEATVPEDGAGREAIVGALTMACRSLSRQLATVSGKCSVFPPHGPPHNGLTQHMQSHNTLPHNGKNGHAGTPKGSTGD